MAKPTGSGRRFGTPTDAFFSTHPDITNFIGIPAVAPFTPLTFADSNTIFYPDLAQNYAGHRVLRTSNDRRFMPDDVALTFDLSAEVLVSVYVRINDTEPAWLTPANGWTQTGNVLILSSGAAYQRWTKLQGPGTVTTANKLLTVVADGADITNTNPPIYQWAEVPTPASTVDNVVGSPSYLQYWSGLKPTPAGLTPYTSLDAMQADMDAATTGGDFVISSGTATNRYLQFNNPDLHVYCVNPGHTQFEGASAVKMNAGAHRCSFQGVYFTNGFINSTNRPGATSTVIMIEEGAEWCSVSNVAFGDYTARDDLWGNYINAIGAYSNVNHILLQDIDNRTLGINCQNSDIGKTNCHRIWAIKAVRMAINNNLRCAAVNLGDSSNISDQQMSAVDVLGIDCSVPALIESNTDDALIARARTTGGSVGATWLEVTGSNNTSMDLDGVFPDETDTGTNFDGLVLERPPAPSTTRQGVMYQNHWDTVGPGPVSENDQFSDNYPTVAVIDPQYAARVVSGTQNFNASNFKPPYEANPMPANPGARVGDNFLLLALYKNTAKAKMSGKTAVLNYGPINGSGDNKPRINLSSAYGNSHMMEHGKEYWFGYSLWIPGDFSIESSGQRLIIMQAAENRGMNVLQFSLWRNNFHCAVNPVSQEGTTSVSPLIGRWNDIVFNVYWMNNSNGKWDVWVNEELIYSYRGLVCQSSSDDPGFNYKMNHYKSNWNMEKPKQPWVANTIAAGGEYPTTPADTNQASPHVLGLDMETMVRGAIGHGSQTTGGYSDVHPTQQPQP